MPAMMDPAMIRVAGMASSYNACRTDGRRKPTRHLLSTNYRDGHMLHPVGAGRARDQKGG